MKAILVIDMPSSCSKCDFCEHQDEGWLWCSRCKKAARAFDKPDWCPLKPMPDKKLEGETLKIAIENDCYDGTTEDKAYFAGYDKGYNACIDEILGDKE